MLLLTAIGFGFFVVASTAATEPPVDYSPLVDFISIDDREKPLFAFDEFEESFEPQGYSATLRYLNDHPDLLRRIRQDVGKGELRWTLERVVGRFLYVPETRKAYARLFERYCRDVIDYALEQTGLSNPYTSIETLTQERPEIPERGVAAFLVHNLAKEYVATYIFSGMDNKKVKVALKGLVFVGEIGSYTTNIQVKESGGFDFEKDSFTVWQNSAKKPYSVLTAPVEETIHIALRDDTHRAIRQELSQQRVDRMTDVKRIARKWVRFEEAVAGGLTHILTPAFLKENAMDVPADWIDADLQSKMGSSRYRHLRRGIQMTNRLGCKRILQLYRDDPVGFGRRIDPW